MRDAIQKESAAPQSLRSLGWFLFALACMTGAGIVLLGIATLLSPFLEGVARGIGMILGFCLAGGLLGAGPFLFYQDEHAGINDTIHTILTIAPPLLAFAPFWLWIW